MFADPWAYHQSVKKRAAPYQKPSDHFSAIFPNGGPDDGWSRRFVRYQLAGYFPAGKTKPQLLSQLGFRNLILTMTYSHMGKPHTTIGDASFHC
jgi:hypothetical protein